MNRLHHAEEYLVVPATSDGIREGLREARDIGFPDPPVIRLNVMGQRRLVEEGALYWEGDLMCFGVQVQARYDQGDDYAHIVLYDRTTGVAPRYRREG